MKRALVLGALLAAGVWACFDFDGAQRQFCQDSFGSYENGRCLVGGPDGGVGGGAGGGTGAGTGGGSGGGTGGGGGGGAGGGAPDPYEKFVADYSALYCGAIFDCTATTFASRSECELFYAATFRETHLASAFIASATTACFEAFAVPSEYRCALLQSLPLACSLVFSNNGVEGDPCARGCGQGPFLSGGCEAAVGATNDCQGKCAYVERCGVDGGFCRSTERCANNACVALPQDGGLCSTTRCHPDFYCSNSTFECVPRKPTDAGCSQVTECQVGLTCSASPQDPNGVCHPWGDVGDACQSLTDCRPGLACLEYTKTCGYPMMVDAGAPCGNGFNCKDMMCRLADGGGFASGGPGVGTCARPQPGELCASTSACGVGQTCGSDGGGCRPAQMLTPCSSSLNCPANGYCNVGVRQCFPRTGDGGTCNINDGNIACVDGLTCVSDGTATGGRCLPGLQPLMSCWLSSDCAAPAQCVAGTCMKVGTLGNPCVNGGFCFDGACNRVSDGGLGSCVAPRADQSPCELNLECASGYCDKAFKFCRAGTCP